ncbi:MAG: hypothetical protein LQ340_001517 [Diploschistes diacapsis]|nr:MAG: hypothetical protein LQ340_001517 [Diploschistes diacapsis]
MAPTTRETPASSEGVYSLVEVSKHNNAKDIWVAMWNHVYDVTSYQEDHPGGKEFLIENAGMDATTAYEDIGHSTDAREILETFRIGRIADEDWADYSTKKIPDVTPSSTHIVNNLPPPKSYSYHIPLISAGLLSTVLAVVLGRQFSNVMHRLQSGGFWKGFALSSLASLSFALLASQWAVRNLNIAHRDFQSYPAHFKSKQSVSRRPVKKDINLGVLNAREYQPFPLVKKYALSHDTYRFVFGLPHENSVLGLPTGQHIAIRHEVNGKQIARSYTPTSSNKDLGRLELTIKIYPGGMLTPYLKSLNIGDMVEIRGPKGEMKYHKNLVKELGMIAGGTGITPMFQIVRRICEDSWDDTKMSLLYGNKTEKDILLREELENLAKAHSEQLQIYHVLSEPPEGWQQGSGRIDKNLIKERLPAPAGDETKVLVCGPDGMMIAMRDTLMDLGFKKPSNISHPRDEIFMF